ncbi:MAG TPA: intradiol ring-cleavage dioxygenase [Usitatibacter sp.]|nr:intradiol ring-cleavage dioxygenase [Usitatibacter sp.]
MRETIPARRQLLRALGAAALVGATPLDALACGVIPSETQGPYPGDGSNGPNVLTQSGIVRSDIRASFGAAGTAITPGTPLTVTLQVVNADDGCTPLAGHAVYIWHCNASGQYSMYSSGATTQNWLRGVQVTDANGQVTFTTVYPGCYSGRWPHIHFEIYPSLAQAVAGSNAVKTSQIAMPEAANRAVYAQASLYPQSLANQDQVTLLTDNVFGDDGGVYELGTVTGSLASGYAVTLQAGISASGTSPDIDQQGLTGMWYEPASSGQGLALEVYPDLRGNGVGFLQGGWFTFDVAPAGGAEKQRWYTFSGTIAAGGATATLPLYVNTGGNFNASPITTGQVAGSVTIDFSSCTEGAFAYTFSDGRSGAIPLTRLTPNVTCSTTTARPTNADFALSGNWYQPSTSGQGFIIEVNPAAPVVFFAWYTYAVNGSSLGAAGQRWFTGQGAYSSGQRTMTAILYETTGGVFDTDTPSSQSSAAVGSATLAFSSCEAATLTYAFTSGSNAGQAGTIPLGRVAATPAGCTA